MTDPAGTAHFTYDAQGRVLSATDADGDETDHFATDGQGHVVSGYNLAGQLLATVLPATGQQGAGRSYTVTSYLYPGGPATGSALYDEGGSLIRQAGTTYGPAGETLAASGTTQSVGYTYDGLYRLTAITDGDGHTTRYMYSPAGYLTGVSYPGASGSTGFDTQTSTYDAAGYLTKSVDGRGVEADYGYDAAGSLSSVQYPSSSGLNEQYAYDAYDRVTSIGDGPGSRSYAYDDGGRVTGEQTQYAGLPAEAITYAYYPDGSRSGMTTPGGQFSYQYDGAGRLASLTDPFGETSTWVYRPNGWLAQQTLADGVQTVYSQDALGRLARLTNQTTGQTPTVLSDFTVPSQGGYDGAGDRLGVTATLPAAPTSFSGQTAYAYDPLDRLTGEQSQRNAGYTSAFGFDGGGATGAGDLTTLRGTSHSYNADNQDTANAYDGAGNPTTYGGQSLSFDAESRMTSFGGVETNGYRSDGLRAVKQSSAGTTYFLYDGDDPVCELNASGSVTAVNTFGGAGLLSRHTTATNASTFYTFDERGDVAQRLDATGAPLSTDLYDAYGARSSTASSQPDPFGFAGQDGCYTDAETGLVLCGHRYYDPAAGRFLNRDPAGYAGGLNLYAYAADNPVTQDDPSGFNPQSDGGDQSNYLKAQLALGAAGFVPGLGAPANLASAGLSFQHGDWVGGALSLAAVIPFLGDGADAANEARRAKELLELEEAEQQARAEAEAAQQAEAKGITTSRSDKPIYPNNNRKLKSLISDATGMNSNEAGDAIHNAKQDHGLTPDDNIGVDRNGNLYNPNGEWMGHAGDYNYPR